MAWNKVPKPTTRAWTSVSKPSTVNWIAVTKPTSSSWMDVAKPVEASIVTSAFTGGEPIGLLLALTKSNVIVVSSVITGWTDISKPLVPNWTKVIKPTS